MPDEVQAAGGAVRTPVGNKVAVVVRGGGVVRWRCPGAEGELLVEPGRAAVHVVPVPAHGASVAMGLVEALDRSATSGRCSVEVCRGSAEVQLLRSPDWQAPERPPAEILAGHPSGGEAPRAARPGTGALEAAELQRVRDYPLTRQLLVARRRRIERRARRAASEFATRKRRRLLLGGATGAALVLAVGAAVVAQPGIAATGALLFMLAAGGVALENFGRRDAALRHERYTRILRGLGRIENELEQDAARLARALDAADPWDAAQRVLEIEAARREAASPESVARACRGIAQRLAVDLGLPAQALDDPAPWAAPRACASSSWPPDVALAEQDGGTLAIVGMARLVQRVALELPRPWPLVLWEPWADVDDAERERRLAALAAAASTRTIIAFVRP